MTPRKTILVPIDFSQECVLIVRAAEEEALRSGHALLLVHVAGRDSPLRQRPPVLLADPLEDYVRHIQRLPKSDIAVLVLEGEPIEEILNLAERENCPAIVMGRGGSPEQPGHVARAIRERFPRKLRLISRFEAGTPVKQTARPI